MKKRNANCHLTCPCIDKKSSGSNILYLRRDVIVAHHRLLVPFLRLPLLLPLALASPRTRLSLISRHLGHRPALEINTPFSSERQASLEDDLPYTPLTRPPPKPAESFSRSKMSSQPEHPTLLIPGPIEFDDEVLQSMSHYRSAQLLCRSMPSPCSLSS